MTIGTLTMADLCADHRSAENKYKRLKERLNGTADDLPQLDLGYIALVNRDTSEVVRHTLEEVNEAEIAWFAENVPEQTENCGIDALTSKLVNLLKKYTTEKWHVLEHDRLLDERNETMQQLSKLGAFLPGNLDELIRHIVSLLPEVKEIWKYDDIKRCCENLINKPKTAAAGKVAETRATPSAHAAAATGAFGAPAAFGAAASPSAPATPRATAAAAAIASPFGVTSPSSGGAGSTPSNVGGAGSTRNVDASPSERFIFGRVPQKSRCVFRPPLFVDKQEDFFTMGPPVQTYCEFAEICLEVRGKFLRTLTRACDLIVTKHVDQLLGYISDLDSRFSKFHDATSTALGPWKDSIISSVRGNFETWLLRKIPVFYEEYYRNNDMSHNGPNVMLERRVLNMTGMLKHLTGEVLTQHHNHTQLGDTMTMIIFFQLRENSLSSYMDSATFRENLLKHGTEEALCTESCAERRALYTKRIDVITNMLNTLTEVFQVEGIHASEPVYENAGSSSEGPETNTDATSSASHDGFVRL
jgi:hypothetical protein